MSVPMRGLSLWAAAVLLGSACVPAEEPPKDDEAARRRLDFMKRKADEFKLSAEKAADVPLAREKEPVLRYTNPARGAHSDGAIFLWVSAGRPAAAATVRVRSD